MAQWIFHHLAGFSRVYCDPLESEEPGSLIDKKRLVGQRRTRDGKWGQFILGHSHFVGAPGDIVVTPFDNDGVAALVLDSVGDVVELVAHMLDIHLLAGGMRSMHSHHQHVGTWTEQ